MPFEPGTYNPEATIGENLRFGTAKGPALADKALAANPYIVSVLKAGLDGTLYDMGLEIARTPSSCSPTAAGQSAVPAADLHDAGEIPDYQILLQRLQGRKYADASTATAQIITLSFAISSPAPLRPADRRADGQDRRRAQPDL